MTSRGVCAGSSGSIRALCSRYGLISGLGGIFLHDVYLDTFIGSFIGVCGAFDVCARRVGEMAIFDAALASVRVIETLPDGD